MSMKEESEKKIQNTKIMASGPITSWQIEGEKVEAVTDFLFLDSKSTVNGDCSHEIKRWLHLGSKAMTNQDHVLKSRDMILWTKVHIVKAIVFLLVVYGCESWTVKENTKELMPSSCSGGEDPWKSLGQQGDQTSQL